MKNSTNLIITLVIFLAISGGLFTCERSSRIYVDEIVYHEFIPQQLVAVGDRVYIPNLPNEAWDRVDVRVRLIGKALDAGSTEILISRRDIDIYDKVMLAVASGRKRAK